MTHLDIAKLKATPLITEPFDYLVVPDFLHAQSLAKVIATYPDISHGGSFPLETVKIADPLQNVIDELNGPEFEAAIEEKFNITLSGKPKMYSLRGYCRKTDGKIHTDSKDKIITVLLYLNESWSGQNGGKLRLLRNAHDMNDFITEVPPDHGTLLVFRRSDNSYHGHESFEGVRRSIQMNWMVSEGKKGFHRIRHKISAYFKKLKAA